MENDPDTTAEEKVFRSGFVSCVGRPNVGKSTFMNRLLGQKIAAVSPRPQTTQRNQLGILTTDDYQIIFIDTPGIHKPLSKLGETMNDVATGTLPDADILLWLVDASVKPNEEDKRVAESITAVKAEDRVIMVLNKADLVKPNQLAENRNWYRKLLRGSEIVEISAKTGRGCDQLLDKVASLLPEGPAYYDEDQITNLYERDIAADLIRESLLKNLEDEIPHSIAVRIDEYIDRTEEQSYIQATLIPDREAHKGIIIGKNGDMIKKIGQDAREEIERLTGRKIYIELKVKPMKNWRNNTALLKQIGLYRPADK